MRVREGGMIALVFGYQGALVKATKRSLSHLSAEVGTKSNIPKAHRDKAQQFFLPVNVQRKMRNLMFSISVLHRNNELFNSVEAQCNSAIAERHCCTKLKSNLTSTNQIYNVV